MKAVCVCGGVGGGVSHLNTLEMLAGSSSEGAAD